MELYIAKWGNSLALRLPAEYVRKVGLKEGDNVHANLTVDGGLSIHPAKFDRKAFVNELKEANKDLPMTDPVMDELRRGERY